MTPAYTKEIATQLENKLPDNHGVVLVVVPFGTGNRNVLYVASLKRKDTAEVLLDVAAKILTTPDNTENYL